MLLEVTDWEGLYHTLVEGYEVERVESAQKMDLKIAELTFDSLHTVVII